MSPRTPQPQDLHEFRSGYLRLRSVLYDRTTDLPAFPVLFSDLRSWLDDRREIGVLHLEIANLGLVESIYGWQVFDRIVARAARALRDAVDRGLLPGESALAVNGVAGDRFVAFVRSKPDGSDCDTAHLEALGRVVARHLEGDFEGEAFASLSPRLRFRVGAALLSENPFYRFERCVYNAVESARAVHERREARRELSWGEELQGIVEQSALEPVYQPIVELSSRAPMGYEALTRGPRDSLFETPRAMFALSDRVGSSGALDRACCESALRGLPEMGTEHRAFVNLLPETLDDESWREQRLLPLLAERGLDPGRLVVEVSDRYSQADDGPLLERLRQAREAGFGVAIDDLGTGRTELETLERSRPDFLKLDVSLVRNIHESLVKQDVLLTLVRLASRIDAAVIAEGVEREEELATLIDGGALYGQGYLFGAPTATGEDG